MDINVKVMVILLESIHGAKKKNKDSNTEKKLKCSNIS